VAAVVVAGSALAACSLPPAPKDSVQTGSRAVAARVVADDPSFSAASAKRPRFFPCQGLSGCARESADAGPAYPGVEIPPAVDGEVDYSAEFVIYLVGARFVEADLVGGNVVVKVTERPSGFQMVKLDARDLATIGTPTFSFEESSRTICSSSWGGCG